MPILRRIRSGVRKLALRKQGLHRADQIFTHTRPEGKDMLFRLARKKAGGTGVEIGSAFGASTCFIAAGIQPNGGKLYCVDTWNTDYRQEGDKVVCDFYGKDGKLYNYQWNEGQQKVLFTEVGKTNGDCPAHEKFLYNTKEFSDVIVSIREDSFVAGKNFTAEIDFLFLDGWHEYDGIKKDASVWLPKVKSGGVVALHDSGWAEGVKRVIEEDVIPRAETHDSLPNMFWALLK